MTADEQARLVALAQDVLIQSYRQPPFVMESGHGVELFDVAGKRYLDMTAGIAVCCLGHAHPRLVERIAEQAGRLIHCSNLYYIEEQLRLAEELTKLSFGDRVFFGNSGAEANEAALKLARRYQRVVNGEERDLIVSTLGSFHGRSIATVSITGQEKYRTSFGRLVEPVRYVPFGDFEAAAAALSGREACAMIVEPIQAEGGIITAPPGYLAGLRELTRETGTVLIFDEVQTGVGRTGQWFAYMHDDVAPDVMTLAKGLAGGVPIGVAVASEAVAPGLSIDHTGVVPHASTFGGNPLACATARAVLEIIEDDDLLANASAAGAYLDTRLQELVARYPGLCTESRGRGLLRGIDLSQPAGDVVARCRDEGLLLSVAGGTVVRFVPPLIIGRAHIDEAVEVLDRVLGQVAL